MNTDITEIKEGLSKYAAESLFKEGWVYLGLKTDRSVDSKGQFEDEVTYILGKPRNLGGPKD